MVEAEVGKGYSTVRRFLVLGHVGLEVWSLEDYSRDSTSSFMGDPEGEESYS